jgi:hypothetical protein
MYVEPQLRQDIKDAVSSARILMGKISQGISPQYRPAWYVGDAQDAGNIHGPLADALQERQIAVHSLIAGDTISLEEAKRIAGISLVHGAASTDHFAGIAFPSKPGGVIGTIRGYPIVVAASGQTTTPIINHVVAVTLLVAIQRSFGEISGVIQGRWQVDAPVQAESVPTNTPYLIPRRRRSRTNKTYFS